MNKLVVRSLYFDPQDFFGTDITEIGSKRYLFGLFLQNNFAVHVPLNSSRQRTVEEKFDAILMEKGRVNAAPELYAGQLDAELIHDAAIGKVAGEQILKLRTLGLTEEEAEQRIINGFLKG